MLISQLETPAVVIDLDVINRNLSRMAEYCRTHKLLLRPHTKSHKSRSSPNYKSRVAQQVSLSPSSAKRE